MMTTAATKTNQKVVLIPFSFKMASALLLITWNPKWLPAKESFIAQRSLIITSSRCADDGDDGENADDVYYGKEDDDHVEDEENVDDVYDEGEDDEHVDQNHDPNQL